MKTNTSGKTQPSSTAAFDRLPKTLRVALANADHNWSGEQLNREYRKPKGRRSPTVATLQAAQDFIQQSDARMHALAVAEGLISDQSDFKPLYARKVRTGRRL